MYNPILYRNWTSEITEFKVLSQNKIIDAPVLRVLSIIGDFSLRSKWMEGVKSVDQVSHPINHVGVKHRSVKIVAQ